MANSWVAKVSLSKTVVFLYFSVPGFLFIKHNSLSYKELAYRSFVRSLHHFCYCMKRDTVSSIPGIINSFSPGRAGSLGGAALALAIRPC
jgi:thioredoxin-related protein